MKKYEYKKLKAGILLGAELKEHRQIIDDYAAKGYRFVACIPTCINNNGVAFEFDLVFELDCD